MQLINLMQLMNLIMNFACSNYYLKGLFMDELNKI